MLENGFSLPEPVNWGVRYRQKLLNLIYVEHIGQKSLLLLCKLLCNC